LLSEIYQAAEEVLFIYDRATRTLLSTRPDNSEFKDKEKTIKAFQGQIDYMKIMPKPEERSRRLEKVLFDIWFFCDSKLKDHPLGSDKCYEILSYAVSDFNLDEINELVFNNQKDKDEVKKITVDLLTQLRKEHIGDREDNLGGVFYDSGRDDVGMMFQKQTKKTWDNADDSRLDRKKIIDMSGCNVDQIKEKVCGLFGLTPKELSSDKRRGHIYKLINRANSNNGILEYYPGYHK